jgi:hypothetical protein
VVDSTTKSSTCDRLVDFTDILPTIAESAILTVPSQYNNHGVSFLRDLQGGSSKKDFQLAFYPSISIRLDNASLYVRNQDYKYYPDNYLIDLDKDPEELRPIYPHEDTEELVRIRMELKAFLQQKLKQFPELKSKWQAIRQKVGGKIIGGGDSSEVSFEQKQTLRLDVTEFVHNAQPQFEIFHRRGFAMTKINNVRLLRDGQELARDENISQSAMAIFDRSSGEDYVFFSLKDRAVFDLSFKDYKKAQYTLLYDVEVLPVEKYNARIKIPLGMFLKSEDHKRIENNQGTVLYRSSGLVRILD